MGASYARRGELDDALRVFQTAYDVRTKRFPLVRDKTAKRLADVYWKLGNRRAAAFYYQRALSHDKLRRRDLVTIKKRLRSSKKAP